MVTQKQQVLDALESGEALTPAKALAAFGAMRLGAIIHSLRQDGHTIITDMMQCPGNARRRYARYSMVSG